MRARIFSKIYIIYIKQKKERGIAMLIKKEKDHTYTFFPKIKLRLYPGSDFSLHGPETATTKKIIKNDLIALIYVHYLTK